jgi:hypothetical protein
MSRLVVSLGLEYEWPTPPKSSTPCMLLSGKRIQDYFPSGATDDSLKTESPWACFPCPLLLAHITSLLCAISINKTQTPGFHHASYATRCRPSDLLCPGNCRVADRIKLYGTGRIRTNLATGLQCPRVLAATTRLCPVLVKDLTRRPHRNPVRYANPYMPHPHR